MEKAYNTLKDEVEIHSIFEAPEVHDGTVNVPPEDAEEAMEILEDAGYSVVSLEDLRETTDTDGDAPGDPGELFTRIKFKE